MIVPVYLWGADGRLLTWVSVEWPVAPEMVWQGRTFRWGGYGYLEVCPGESSVEASVMPTDQQRAMARAMGIDLSKIDWTKVATLIQFVLNLFIPDPTPTPAPTVQGVKSEHQESCDCCARSACLSLQAALCCLEHIHKCSEEC